MALVLTLGVGKDFYVEGARILVTEIDTPTCFTLQTEDGKSFKVTDAEWVAILPGVRVQSALEKPRVSRTARVSVDAPGLRILRGNPFRQQESFDSHP